MTEIVPTNLDARVQHAKLLAEASLLPDAYRRQPANILLVQEMAEALGVPLTQAINGIAVIKGKPTMSAEMMRALVLRAGHRLKVETLTDQGCRLLVARREQPDDVQEFTFTMADAQRAGLSGDTWKRHPKSMLLARCTTQACRAVFPDVLAGVSYTPDELDGEPAPPLVMPRIPRAPEPAHDPATGEIVDAEVIDPGEEDDAED